MKTILHFDRVLSVFPFCLSPLQAAPVAPDQPAGFRLTIDLPDGSKIIGKCSDNSLLFRSDVPGEMKLSLERIHASECRPQTNSVQLATVNGDTLTAQFVTKAVYVETAFGNFKLPVNLIRHRTVS